MIDQKHSKRGCQGKTKIESQKEVTKALSTVGLRTDIGDESGGRRIEECEPKSMNHPNHEEGPERGNKDIGHGAENEEEGADEHEISFRGC